MRKSDSMKPNSSPPESLIDYITGVARPDIGAEANRQKVEQHLVDTLGYDRSQIEVDAPISFEIEGQLYVSRIDLVVSVQGRRFMVIKCAPGSLDSREREVVAAARLLDEYQIPLAVASDGATALVWDTLSSKRIGQGLEAIPSRTLAQELAGGFERVSLEAAHRERTKLVFRSYDSMNVNVAARSASPETDTKKPG